MFSANDLKRSDAQSPRIVVNRVLIRLRRLIRCRANRLGEIALITTQMTTDAEVGQFKTRLLVE